MKKLTLLFLPTNRINRRASITEFRKNYTDLQVIETNFLNDIFTLEFEPVTYKDVYKHYATAWENMCKWIKSQPHRNRYTAPNASYFFDMYAPVERR